MCVADDEVRLGVEGLPQQQPQNKGRASTLEQAEQQAQHGDLQADQAARKLQAEQRQKERKAKEAATKLQELGATVYPPGDKHAVEWGILAGRQLLKNGPYMVNVPSCKPCCWATR